MARVPRPDRHDAIGLVEWQAADQDGVDEGEHRAVHADAEREGDHGDGAEPAILHEEADGKTKILQKAHVVSPGPGTRILN